jgi:hypothetical protein
MDKALKATKHIAFLPIACQTTQVIVALPILESVHALWSLGLAAGITHGV